MSSPEAAKAGFSEDAYFGGRLTLRQPVGGLRAGDDALFLAATIPAVAGERVFEAGVGTGAAALAMLARIAGTRAVGVEIDPAHAALARENARLNGLDDRLCVIEADIASATAAVLRERRVIVPFDHAFANPPFYEAGRVREPASRSRRNAHLAQPGAIDIWVARLADLVTGGGSVTVIHLAAALGPLLAAFEARLGGVVVLPLSPRDGEAASRVIVQARKGSRAALSLRSPVILHRADGHYTSSADRVLRDGAALTLA